MHRELERSRAELHKAKDANGKLADDNAKLQASIINYKDDVDALRELREHNLDCMMNMGRRLDGAVAENAELVQKERTMRVRLESTEKARDTYQEQVKQLSLALSTMMKGGASGGAPAARRDSHSSAITMGVVTAGIAQSLPLPSSPGLDTTRDLSVPKTGTATAPTSPGYDKEEMRSPPAAGTKTRLSQSDDDHYASISSSPQPASAPVPSSGVSKSASGATYVYDMPATGASIGPRHIGGIPVTRGPPIASAPAAVAGKPPVHTAASAQPGQKSQGSGLLSMFWPPTK